MNVRTLLLSLITLAPVTAASVLQIRYLPLGEDQVAVRTAAIDTAGASAYFGVASNDFPYSLEGERGAIVHIDLETFKQAGTIRLKPGENPVSTLLIDPSGRYAYAGVYGDPNRDVVGSVVKVRLSDGGWLGAMPLGKREYGVGSSVQSPGGGLGYFGTLYGTVVGMRLSDLSVAASLGLQRMNNAFSCAVVDHAGEFGYFATTSGAIMKISLKDFTPAATLTALRSDHGFRAALIDSHDRFAYFLTDESPAKIYRVELASFRLDRTEALAVGQNGVGAAFLDAPKSRLLIVTSESPAAVVEVALPSLDITSIASLPEKAGRITCGVFDRRRQAIVLGAQTSTRAQIVRVPIP